MNATQHEQSVQRRFTDIISGRGIESASRHHKVYNRLLFYRFEEVIENAFARLRPLVEPHEWNSLIAGFIQHGGRSPYIWQLPNEFRKYAADKIALPFARDLLWFEWIEIELMMQKPREQQAKTLRWNRPATLSPTARIKKLAYPVHDKGSDASLPTAQKAAYPLLVYLEPETHRVMFLEITPFMYKVLKSLKKKTTPKEAVRLVAKAYGEKSGEVSEIIRPVLERFYALGILI